MAAPSERVGNEINGCPGWKGTSAIPVESDSIDTANYFVVAMLAEFVT
jgi:hypothetical protein